MGGVRSSRSPLCISYDLTVRAVCAPTWCLFAWIAFLVVARLAFQLEVVRVQADVRVVAVAVVKPDPPMVDDLAGLYAAGLTNPAVDCLPCRYV